MCLVAFFVVNKTVIKIYNLIVAHWLNTLCKGGGVKWHNCCQCTIHVTQLLTCTFTYRSLFSRKTGHWI